MEIFKKGVKEWERGVTALKRGGLEDGKGAGVVGASYIIPLLLLVLRNDLCISTF